MGSAPALTPPLTSSVRPGTAACPLPPPPAPALPPAPRRGLCSARGDPTAPPPVVIPPAAPAHPQPLPGTPFPAPERSEPPALQAAQHPLPVQIPGSNPCFPTWFSAPNFSPIRLLEIPANPPPQLGGRGTRQLCRPRLLRPPGIPGTTHRSLPGPGSRTTVCLPPLQFCFPYPAENERSRGFVLLHLDSVGFLSHKRVCRFLGFFICSLRLQ